MYEVVQTKIDRISDAQKVLSTIRSAYQSLVKVRTLMLRYTTDANFKATVDTLFTAQELADLNAIATKAKEFLTDLETNHRNAVGLS